MGSDPNDLVIRPEQMRVFQDAAQAQFERDMLSHLAEHFPEQVAALGLVGLQGAIRHGFERATAYGLDSPYAVCAYLDVMFLFGKDFDRDERLPWASAVLTDPSIIDGCARADELTETALEYIDFLAAQGS